MTDADRREPESEPHTGPSPDPREAPAPPGFAARALGAQARVVEENGRWVVYLSVDFWEPEPSAKGCNEKPTESDSRSSTNRDSHSPDWPIQSYVKRIADYPDRQRALVAAQWIERSADRNLWRPPGGF